MDPVTVGVLGTVLLVLLLLMGMPIAFMMMLVGSLGIWKLSALTAALPIVAQTLYSSASHYP
ncbi:MAG TPA: C4-dicarboxylate ABC transporter permease, partial [Desulfobacterales bacterium]|nr:C4-dicarboxylate ABC transporter permease [Desulfobacterales bacterium]